MGDKSKIEWTDATWNPVTGCTKVSQGCKNCYAERLWQKVEGARVKREGVEALGEPRPFSEVRCHPERLDIPLHWKRPRRIFVNSMSDLFHESVPDEFIDRVLAIAALAPDHTFQILTKRPQRVRSYFKSPAVEWCRRIARLMDQPDWISLPSRRGFYRWPAKIPLPNVHIGVSCEDQATADERIPLLLQTPAAVRFVSLEPLLGPIDLNMREYLTEIIHYDSSRKHGLDWVIVGGESGPNARPMHPDWVRSIRDQCQAAAVPFFMKQMGSVWAKALKADLMKPERQINAQWAEMMDAWNGSASAPELWPEDLRVREFPI